MQRSSSPVSPIEYTPIQDRDFHRTPQTQGQTNSPAIAKTDAFVTAESRDGSDGGSGRYSNNSSRPRYIWWSETICCFLFVGALVGIVAMVWSFDGRPLPHWPYRVSMNTLIAAFSVLLKASAGLVLAEAISHIKWTNLKRPESLRSFTVHDDASRGPWGAVMLLWNDKGRHISSLGALVIILILFMEPFTQQIVSFYGCDQVDAGVGTIPRTNFYAEERRFTGGTFTNLPWNLHNSVNQGLYATNKPQIGYHCRTGNCTFDGSYSSLAFCSKCEDVTKKLVPVPWPNPKNITPVPEFARYPRMVLPSSGTKNLTLTLDFGVGSIEEARNVLVARGSPSIEVIRSLDPQTYVAHSCNISACIKTYNATLQNNKLEENLLEEHLITLDPASRASQVADLECVNDLKKQQLSEMGYDLKANPRWLPYNTSIYYNTTNGLETYDGSCEFVPADKVDKFCDKSKTDENGEIQLTDEAKRIVPKDCVYFMDNFLATNLHESLLKDVFNGTLTEWWSMATPALMGPEPLWALRHAGSGNTTLQDMSDLMKNVSASMTTWLRESGHVNMSSPMKGQVTTNTVCIKVQWPWVAFAASIVLLTLVFFIYIVIKSRGDQAELRRAWENEGVHAPYYDFKSSVLTLLFHGLDDESRKQMINVGSSNLTAEMEKRTTDVRIQLVATERGWKLSTAKMSGS